jgi:hypothetical protein
MSVYPDIALIGVAKGGTTALATWFESHPEVAVSRIKEPNFFSTDIRPETFSRAYLRMSPPLSDSYWAQSPLPPEHQDFVQDAGRYARLFEHAQTAQKTLEASTSYFFSRTAPDALFEANPSAHIVLILRNPVERAFSHYRMARKYGMVQSDFLTALAEDAAQPAAWGQSENFVHLSRYAESLRRWQSRWPAQQLHIYRYEDFFQDEVASWSQLCLDLGLSPHPLPERTKVFEGQDPAYPALQTFLTQHPVGRWLKSLIPSTLRGGAKKALTAKSALSLTAAERQAAWTYFETDRAECETLLNRPLSLWT